jgi:hypothetical protein
VKDFAEILKEVNMAKVNETGQGAGRSRGEKRDNKQIKSALPPEKPDGFYKNHHHQPEFDTDIEDPNAYRERQENYIQDLDLEDDPGTFEN